MSEVEGKPDVAPRWLELLFLAKGKPDVAPRWLELLFLAISGPFEKSDGLVSVRLSRPHFDSLRKPLDHGIVG
jgi:hypothetical protein